MSRESGGSGARPLGLSNLLVLRNEPEKQTNGVAAMAKTNTDSRTHPVFWRYYLDPEANP